MQPGWRPGPGMGFFHTLPSPPSSRPQTPRSLRQLGALASFLETCFLPHLPGHIKTAGRALAQNKCSEMEEAPALRFVKVV